MFLILVPRLQTIQNDEMKNPSNSTMTTNQSLENILEVTTHTMSYPGIGSAVARYCPLWAPLPSRFCFWELMSNFPVGHPSCDCFSPNSLNFGVPMTQPVSSQKVSC
ncbi:unnamed protein product [Prunus armeniaca]